MHFQLTVCLDFKLDLCALIDSAPLLVLFYFPSSSLPLPEVRLSRNKSIRILIVQQYHWRCPGDNKDIGQQQLFGTTVQSVCYLLLALDVVKILDQYQQAD